MVTFAIVCLGRTGSELLVSLLDSHPEITCRSEVYFDPAGVYLDPLELGRLLSESVPTWPGKAHGMKLTWEAFDEHPDWFDLMRLHDFRVIRLTRENLFDQFLSMRLSQLNGDWSSTGSGYTTQAFDVDPRVAGNSMRYFRTCNLMLREATRAFPSVDVTYEEITAGTGFDRILSLLGVDPVPLTTSLRKQRNSRQAEIVRNYTDVRAALAGSPWERYLTG